MLKLSLHCVLLARLSLCATCRDDAIAFSLSFDKCNVNPFFVLIYENTFAH